MSLFLIKNDHKCASSRCRSRRNAFAASCSLPLAVLSSVAAVAQAMEGAVPRVNVPWVNRNLVWIDAGHAGQDTGVQLGKNLFEKDVTAAVAANIRTLLTARGLMVVQTPTVTDPQAAVGAVAAAGGQVATGGQVAVPQTAPPQTADDRAGIANHAHPFACVLLHASDRGTGVHIVTSAIAPRAESEAIPRAIPWDVAQGWWLPESRRLANQVGLAIEKSGLPTHLVTASARPIDSLMCPAVAVEMAPAKGTPATNPGYQQRVAEAIAGALLAWHDRMEPPAKAEGAVAPKSAPGAPATPGVPGSASANQRPAPILRRPPSLAGPLPAGQAPAPIIRRPPSGTGTGGTRPPGSQP